MQRGQPSISTFSFLPQFNFWTRQRYLGCWWYCYFKLIRDYLGIEFMRLLLVDLFIFPHTRYTTAIPVIIKTMTLLSLQWQYFILSQDGDFVPKNKITGFPKRLIVYYQALHKTFKANSLSSFRISQCCWENRHISDRHIKDNHEQMVWH